MKITRIDSYHKHGCSFHGKLAVVNYRAEWMAKQKTLPADGFNSMSIYDYVDEATKLARERYPNCEILLSIPDLVVRIEAEAQS